MIDQLPNGHAAIHHCRLGSGIRVKRDVQRILLGRRLYERLHDPPRSVVRLMVEIIEPHGGTVFDPACGSGGMFVQSAQFIGEHRKELEAQGADTSVFVSGQEKESETVKLALGTAAHAAAIAVRGIEGDWTVSRLALAGAAGFILLGVAQGLGFGMLLRNTPAAIVLYYVLPTGWSILGSMVSWVEDAAAWRDDVEIVAGDVTDRAIGVRADHHQVAYVSAFEPVPGRSVWRGSMQAFLV